MKLGKILQHIQYEHFSGDPEVAFKEITYDSRAVKQGDLFVAVKGSSSDGHLFLEEAVKRGAAALVVADPRKCPEKVPCIQVADTRDALAQLAVHFYHRPFEQMNLIGITGTNGKTTVTYLLESILTNAGRKVGVIGTVSYRFPGEEYKAPVTTPESLDLMRIMRKMADARVGDVLMEVSSHALDQGRTRACPFRVAVFTNLSRDHLDYHGSMEAYFEAKSALFTSLKKDNSGRQPVAVINMDDPWGATLNERTTAEVITYGFGKECDVRAVDVRASGTGTSVVLKTPKGDAVVQSALIGDFNVYNMLTAAAVAIALGLSTREIVSGIEALPGVPGRLERVKNSAEKKIVVDYAHTPDALAKALQVVRSYAEERLICVFGCGGDRDKGKRKEMGWIAAQLSDVVILTSDNPRNEDPEAIISQIEEGIRLAGITMQAGALVGDLPSKVYRIVPDRAEAIQVAVTLATDRDLVFIAGKGHETYQIVGQEIRDFDDRKIAAQAVS
jgi:UDP-N-acetylmuramoyl-L-alanyl-D-glutamate--2,6-diaminopimelate ligase